MVAWEWRIVTCAREGAHRRARSKGGADGGVPVPAELMRNDYMHEEYGDLDSDFVFVNLWGGQVGRPLTHKMVARTQRRAGFHFTAHELRHTYATLAYRDGVQLEVLERDEQSLTRILEGLDQIEEDQAGGDQLDLRDLAASDETDGA